MYVASTQLPPPPISVSWQLIIQRIERSSSHCLVLDSFPRPIVTSCTSRQPTDSHSYCDLPGHILKSCPSSSAAITINGCCTTDQACPRCPTSAHGKRSTSLRSPSARLPTSPGCVLCRPPPPRRSRPRHPPSLFQVWP